MFKMASPPVYFQACNFRVVHKLPRRVRFKFRFLKNPNLNLDYVQAHLSLIPGVVRVRINPHAASLVIRHTGVEDMDRLVLAAMNSLPQEAFMPGRKRATVISRGSVARHLAVAALCPVLPAFAKIPLALMVGLPVVWDGIKNLFSNGITAKSLDAVSTGLCFALRNWTAVGVIAFMRLFGDYLKQCNDRHSNELLTGLLRLNKSTVWVDRGSVEVEVGFDAVQVGDVVVCGPGEMVAVDGEVVSGQAQVNKSMITGESVPVHVSQGSHVVSGSVVECGRIRIMAEKVGRESSVARINRFLERTLMDKSLPELKGDLLADKLVPVTLGLGAGAYLLTSDLARTASVASIDYVCSVKFPAQFSVRSSMCAAGRCGMLLKGGRALDALAKVDTVVFDKTGTLTLNRMKVTDIVSTGDMARDEILALAARMERHYDHPVARTVLEEAGRCGIGLEPVSCVDFHVSNGVSAIVDGKKALVGSRRFVYEANGLSGELADAIADEFRGQGKMVLYVASEDQVQGLIAMRDVIRPHAAETLAGLRKLGVKKIVVLTGDHEKTARHFRDSLTGINELHWELKPEDKAGIVNQLRGKGRCVAVVGDGINDAPALACADIGICMNHGGDLARVSAQAVILNNDLRALCRAKHIAARQHRILDHCYRQGAVVNSMLLVMASVGMLSPLAAAVFHNLNTFALVGSSVVRAGAAPACESWR